MTADVLIKPHGRGALENPTGRFERVSLSVSPEEMQANLEAEGEEFDLNPNFKTEVFLDKSKTVITTNDSPDVGMEVTVNPYRGCEHGCIYCYARPTHEYFGLSAGVDFERKIFAKPDAPKLLRDKLMSKGWQPQTVFFSGVTDCYQPIERKMKITRSCLEVLRDFKNPVAMITKSHLVTRDIDILSEMAAWQGASVALSITTLDRDLARRMEPRAATPSLRFKAIETLAKAGIPVSVMIGPVLPGLTEHEIDGILKSAASAGAYGAGYNMLRLPYGVKDLFQTWLKEHYPNRANKVLGRIRDVRGGKLNSSAFGERMRGEGFYAEQIHQIFTLARNRYNLNQRRPLSAEHFQRPGQAVQMALF